MSEQSWSIHLVAYWEIVVNFRSKSNIHELQSNIHIKHRLKNHGLKNHGPKINNHEPKFNIHDGPKVFLIFMYIARYPENYFILKRFSIFEELILI